MENDKVYNLLEEYNEDEIFYRELFLNRNNPYKYSKLMKSLTPDKISDKELIIPDSNYKINSHTRLGDDYFDSKIHKNVYLSKHNRYTPLYEHDHEFFEIVYVLSGQCENHIFGETDILRQGDLCLLSPSVTHSIWTEEGLVINILIRRSTVQNVFSNIFRGHSIISDFFTNSLYLRNFATCLKFRTNGDRDIRDQILGMYGEQLEADEYSENIISNMLMLFFNKLVRGYHKTAAYPQTVKKQNETVSQILSMIVNEYADISLPVIADRLGYSVVYCSKYIKQTTGYTFSHLLKKIKLEKAKDLLNTTSMSVSEISNICGYENPENFNRAFRQRYNVSPTAFRELHNKNTS